MRTNAHRLAPIACGLLVAGVASAQVDPRARGVEALQPVEAGSVDSSPLAGSMQVLPIDLRQPTGFDEVYQINTGRGSAFARMDGALRAVFPRSEYGLGPNGVESQIPAGTTWVIGDTPTWYADRFGMIATEPATAAGPPVPGTGVLAQRVDMSATALNPRAGSNYAGSNAAALPAPMIDGVRVPAARPLVQLPPREPPAEPIDLSGVLADPTRAHRTVIADEPASREEQPQQTAARDERDDTPASPWADDAARGRTVALLLLKAAGSDEVRQRDDAVATVETDTE
ncbi:MAG: hypothetical protein RIB60_03720 [Phycisphaerales bacterium]